MIRYKFFCWINYNYIMFNEINKYFKIKNLHEPRNFVKWVPSIVLNRNFEPKPWPSPLGAVKVGPNLAQIQLNEICFETVGPTQVHNIGQLKCKLEVSIAYYKYGPRITIEPPHSFSQLVKILTKLGIFFFFLITSYESFY